MGGVGRWVEWGGLVTCQPQDYLGSQWEPGAKRRPLSKGRKPCLLLSRFLELLVLWPFFSSSAGSPWPLPLPCPLPAAWKLGSPLSGACFPVHLDLQYKPPSLALLTCWWGRREECTSPRSHRAGCEPELSESRVFPLQSPALSNSTASSVCLRFTCHWGIVRSLFTNIIPSWTRSPLNQLNVL